MALTLRRRILLSVMPLVVLLAALGGVGAVLLSRLGTRSDAILRENYDSVRAMVRLNEALERIDSSLQFALIGKEDDAAKDYRANWDRFNEQLDIEARNITIHPDEPRLVAELQNLADTFRTQGDAFFRRRPGDATRKTDYFGTKERPGLLQSFRDIKRVSTAIHDLNEEQMTRMSRDAQETARISVMGLLLALLVSVLMAVVSGWWLQRSIVGPIESVTEAALAIGGGQLHLMVPVPGNDEVGRLAEAFNAMTQKLRAYRQSDTQRLLRARQTAQATIDSFPDPVVVSDLQGRVEFANPAAQRVLGVYPSETSPIWQPPPSLHQAWAAALEQQRSYLTETFDQAVTFRLDGDERTYLPQIRLIRSPEGELLGAAVVLNDVTRFRLLDRLKSDWVATVSHELKTPLTGVRLAVHVLLEEVVGPLEPKQVELLLEARDNTERLLKLIEHLLSLARLEDGREKLAMEDVDPTSLLRAGYDSAASRAEDRRIELVVETPPGLPRVLVDPSRFGQALNNLIDNALTYTQPGGKVMLSAARDGDGVRLTVADTGIGIPPEHLPHVFDRFFRVPGRDGTPGTGLGLAIVREIVTAHEGRIVCESEPGKGTAFHITLPIREVSR